jgi:cobalt-zinc-cadmium efflux system membrane fusion protein
MIRAARLSGITIVFTAVLLVAAGALATYIVMRPPVSAPIETATAYRGATAPPAAPRVAATGDISGNNSAPPPDVAVTLSEDAVQRAGLEVATVAASSTASHILLPGTIQPNAYRSVVVKPVVAGRVTRVMAELGQAVRRGQTLAEIYSPELADAQTRFLSSRAELEAHELTLRRTVRLVEIGAASQQELEKVHAEHAAATTLVESNRARLTLLGMTGAQLSSATPFTEVNASAIIAAPIDGIITTRDANVGLAVDPATALFTVVDLSTVWVVGDLYEQDFASVRKGSPVVVTTTAYPNLAIPGQVSYIDAQVTPETRTARLRAEIPNPQRQLRLGMYAEMRVSGATRPATPAVLRSALQTVGDRSMVYVADPQERGRFLEREVVAGEVAGEQVAVVRGLQIGEVVVVKGSFSLRAERERLGLRPPARDMAPPHTGR